MNSLPIQRLTRPITPGVLWKVHSGGRAPNKALNAHNFQFGIACARTGHESGDDKCPRWGRSSRAFGFRRIGRSQLLTFPGKASLPRSSRRCLVRSQTDMYYPSFEEYRRPQNQGDHLDMNGVHMCRAASGTLTVPFTARPLSRPRRAALIAAKKGRVWTGGLAPLNTHILRRAVHHRLSSLHTAILARMGIEGRRSLPRF
jgi:hypothetical protein